MTILALMPRIRLFFIIILLALTGLFSWVNQCAAVANEENIKAVIDLRNIKDEDFYSPVDGEWFYFDKQLLLPTEVYNYIFRNDIRTVQIPSSFKELTGRASNYGTFATRVKIPEDYVGRTLAFYVPHQYSAYKLFVDQVEISSNGVTGTNRLEHRTEMSPQIGYYTPIAMSY